MFLVRKKEKDDRKEEKKKKNTLLVASLKDDAEPLVSSSVTVVLSAANVQPATEFHQARPNESERTPQQFGTSEQWFRDAMSSHNKETNSQNGSVTFQSFPVLKDLPKLSLPALAPVQVNQRTLTLHRNVAGDFGFNVRRTQFPDFRGRLRAVVFAEPTEVRCGPPRPSDIRAGLLPGDQLVKMNGRSVESLGREELLAIIQNSGDQVELTVRAMPELAELCDRTQRGVRDTGDSLMLPPVSNTYLDENITEDERYWLMHKNGYTMARMIETQSDGKVHVMVAGAEMVVDVTDVDKANPSNMDRVEDLARLRYINETSAVHVLRHRYGSGLLYTNAGALSIICTANEQEPLLCNKLVALFKGCRRQQMPPHIYASAQQAYRKMQMSGRSQCLILTGVTGSGKSTQLRNVCHYLCEIAGWTKSLSYGKISAALGVVEAFGNCATRLSKNATRFAQMFSLSFDAAASLRFASIRTFLLDSSHVVKQANGEANFHVFYYLLEGAEPELVQSLRLDSITKPFRSPLIREEDKNAALLGWSRLKEALSTLGISAAHARAIFSLLAAIGHLCCAGATQSPAQKAQFVRASSAQHAAALLSVGTDQLASAVFRGKMSSGGQSGPGNVMNRFSLSNRGQNGQEALEAFVAHLYNELFYAVVALLNRGLGATNLATTTSITIIDFPGGNFNAAWSEESQRTSGLADLTYNYLNERIAELFYDTSFTEPIELYDREQVEVDIEKPTLCPHQITRLIDQKQQLLNCVDIDLRSEERRGLLHILDEEALFPGATDDSFFERIFVHLGESRLIRRGCRPREFVLGHCLGGSPTVYSVNGWVKAAQPNVSEGSVLTLLHSSRDAAINELFSPFGMTRSESATLNIRRATQAAKLDATGLPTACGFFSNISMQTECIISFARHAGGVQFVHCMQPQPPSEDDGRSTGSEMLLDVPFVRSQLRSLLIIDATRASSRGYPERLSFKDFRRRFQCLVKSSSSLDDVLDDRAAAGRILEDTGVFPHTYRLGLSQVLLRSDVLADLENRRELCLSGLIVSFQRACRKHLSAKWLARRRTLDSAIRCIQRSGKCYIKVREWSWWRLYTKVTPLLAAARSDEVYREMETRIRELEAINNELRVSKSRVEGRVAELEQMLSAECSNTQSLGEALERETEHRLQAQKQLIVMQQRHFDEPRLSSSSSSHLDNSMVLSDAKTTELNKELETLRESEATQRTRAQKAIQRLRDVEGELLDLKARNEILEV
uniref:Myosin-XVIIIa n=1 Tax=Ascaris suum TaxID=6253 RepID=F1KQF8_ASCSU